MAKSLQDLSDDELVDVANQLVAAAQPEPEASARRLWPRRIKMAMKRYIVAGFLLFITVSIGIGQGEKKPLTNADIIAMLEAKLPESAIVLAIQDSVGNFDTSIQSLILLKNKGASDRIFETMRNAKKNEATVAAPKPQISKPRIKVDYKLFTLELVECRLFGTRTTCDLMVTNNDPDRWIEVHGKHYDNFYTRIIDTSGKEYKTSRVQLGSSVSSSAARATLVRGVPFKLLIFFDDVSASLTTLSVLDIALYYEGMSYNDRVQSVQFRNIPLTIETPPDEGTLRVFKNEFTFDFLSCLKSLNKIKCSISMKNNGDAERRIGVEVGDKRYSRMIDGNGLERTPIEGGLATDLIQPGPFKTVFSYGILPRGQSTKIELTFGDAAAIPSIKLLRFSVGYRSSSGGLTDTFNVDFRDVPIRSSEQSQFMPSDSNVIVVPVPKLSIKESNTTPVPTGKWTGQSKTTDTDGRIGNFSIMVDFDHRIAIDGECRNQGRIINIAEDTITIDWPECGRETSRYSVKDGRLSAVGATVAASNGRRLARLWEVKSSTKGNVGDANPIPKPMTTSVKAQVAQHGAPGYYFTINTCNACCYDWHNAAAKKFSSNGMPTIVVSGQERVGSEEKAFAPLKKFEKFYFKDVSRDSEICAQGTLYVGPFPTQNSALKAVDKFPPLLLSVIKNRGTDDMYSPAQFRQLERATVVQSGTSNRWIYGNDDFFTISGYELIQSKVTLRSAAAKSWPQFWAKFSKAVNEKDFTTLITLSASDDDFFDGGGGGNSLDWFNMMSDRWGVVKKAVMTGVTPIKIDDWYGETRVERTTRNQEMIFLYAGQRWFFFGVMGD